MRNKAAATEPHLERYRQADDFGIGPEAPERGAFCHSRTRRHALPCPGSSEVPLTRSFTGLVPPAGLEPARSYEQGILSPWRLPIPPRGHRVVGPAGLEPATKAL